MPPQSGLQSLRRWFLVLTKPSGERCALENLERQGYRVYHPKLLQSARRRGRWVERIVSLFPRYLFVQLETGRQSLAPVRSTLGVSGVVRFGHDAAIVPDGIVDALLRKADPESGLHRMSDSHPLHQGARVDVLAGTFAGIEGIFERHDGKDRAVVLLDLLGRLSPVCVRTAFIAPHAA